MMTNTACLRTDFMTAKKHLSHGFWNVRTLRENSRLDELVEQALKFKLNFLATREVRQLSFGTEILKGHKFLFSGQDDHHREEVGQLLNTKASKALLEWKPVNSRILTAGFASRHAKMTLVSVYAPTNDADSNKDEFYSILKYVIRAAPRYDIMCVLGDFDAKVGDDTEYASCVIGRHG
ncbi:hypothetical protein QYM36_003902, partial [Artemia franciscana]